MKRISYKSVLTFLLFGITSLQAQQSFVLNEPLESLKAQNTGEKETFYFSVNEEAFTHPEFKAGAEVIFNTSQGQEEFVLTRVTEYIPGYISITAADKYSGENVFATTFHEGRIYGLYHKSHNETKKLAYDWERKGNFIGENLYEAGYLFCGIEEVQSPKTPVHSIGGKNKQRNKEGETNHFTAAPLNIGLEDTITIDLMIVYTDAAESWSNTSGQGDIDGVMAQAMNLSQQALDNSETNIELRLVHTHKTTYDETNDGAENSEERLKRLTQNDDDPVFEGTEYNGHMEEVHDLRDEYGADIVAMFARIDDTGGIGWRLGSTGGDSNFGFNLNRVQQTANGYTLIHEIGHNMGNVHARTQQESGASEAGGLFHYSAGYQDEDAGFHTVMAYNTTQSGTTLDEAPYFSSPDLEYEGRPTGTDDTTTPENNALSMRQIKRTVSYYRPSITDPPQIEVSTDLIEVEMNREDNVTIPITITNSGNSRLVWDADFRFPENSVSKQRSASKENMLVRKPVFQDDLKYMPANYSGMMQVAKTAFNEEIIYSTSFENNEGFSINTYAGHNEWRALSDTEFDISNSNSKNGSQHLRFNYDDGQGKFIASPFFGYQTLGTYEVTINFEVSNPAEEVYDFYILDGKAGGLSSGVIIASQTIYHADLDEQGEVSFFGGSETINEGQYYELKIRYNVENQSIDYYLNGNKTYEAEYMEGFSPGVIRVLNRNESIGSYIDIDDVEIKKIEAPYTWLDLPEMNGVVNTGTSYDIELDFTSEGVAAGEYETVMTLRTNESGKERIEIPVKLTVNDVVSNEADEKPRSIVLFQNYPNPFNPVTTIKYTLEQSQTVLLEVFNMQGQRVVVLQNNKVPAGEHAVSFDASKLSSGVYMYRLKTASQTLTKQMVLIK